MLIARRRGGHIMRGDKGPEVAIEAGTKAYARVVKVES